MVQGNRIGSGILMLNSGNGWKVGGLTAGQHNVFMGSSDHELAEHNVIVGGSWPV